MRDKIHCLILPHPKNNHRAHLLHFRSFIVVIALLFLGSFFFSSGLNPFTSRIQAMADISTQELLDFTNEKRQENGLPPLTVNEELEQAAFAKAVDMFDKDYWAHNSPDGTTPWFFIKEAGYNYVFAGENLAKGFTDSKDVVDAWMASPSHKENLLSENFNEVGFAVKSGELSGEYTFLVVQEFGNKTAIPVEKTAVPEPPQEVLTDSRVLAINFPNPSNTFSYNLIALLLVSFIVILLIDMIYIERKNIVRFVGHNLDHVFFLMVVLITLSIFGTGYIL